MYLSGLQEDGQDEGDSDGQGKHYGGNDDHPQPMVLGPMPA